MRRLLVWPLLFFAALVHAQSPTDSIAMNTWTGTAWTPALTTATAGALPVGQVPPQKTMYCYNSGTGQWVPADNSCFNGGSAPGPYLPLAGGTVTGLLGLTGSVSTAITDPGASYLTATPTCVTACSATWVYSIVANNQFGESTNGTLSNSTATTSAQNSTLSGSNFNTLTWSAKTGAYSYDIYRTTAATSPATVGLVARVLATSPLTLVDNGLPAASPTLDPNSNSINVELTPTLLNDTAKTAFQAFIPTDASINGVMIGTGPGNSIIYNGQSTRVGEHALQSNTLGTLNTAVGFAALQLNSTGSEDTAVGNDAMNLNTTGVYDTAVGQDAMGNNTTGSYNVAVGTDALLANQTGQHNTGVGTSALTASTGSNNTAVGYAALNANQFGGNASAFGDAACLNAKGNSNTCLGYLTGQTITSGSSNLVVGDQSDVAAAADTNEVVIGHAATGTGSNTTTIGNASTNSASILGVTKSSKNSQVLAADSSGITATTPGTTEWSWTTLAASTKYSFHCSILYSQATAAGGVGVAVQSATTAATRWDAWAKLYTTNPASTTVTGTLGSTLNVTSTTATSVASATPGATGTVYQGELDGTIQTGATAGTLNVLVYTGNASDAVTVKAGSYCSVLL